MGKPVVLDSSAILAVIFNEPGGEALVHLLQRGLLSAINLAEVHTRLILDGAPSDFAWNSILRLGCEVCPFDDEQARLAAELITKTRPYGLSMGGRACLALAIQRNATVYTTDRTWQNLELDIGVEIIR